MGTEKSQVLLSLWRNVVPRMEDKPVHTHTHTHIHTCGSPVSFTIIVNSNHNKCHLYMPKCVSNLKSVSVVVKCCIAHCWMSGLQLRPAPFSCICCPPIFRPDNVQALFMAAPCFPCLDSIYEWFLPELTKIERIWRVLRFIRCKWCGWEKRYNKHCLWDR